MSLVIKFTKMHGLGNDFVVIDAVSQAFYPTEKLIRHISHRKFGIGCDQVLVLEPPQDEVTDFFYRIFNADGQEVEQCGNGARCIGRFLLDEKLTIDPKITVGTQKGPIIIHAQDNHHISVEMGQPNFDPKSLPAKFPNSFITKHSNGSFSYQMLTKSIVCSLVSMGNPHCILWLSEIDSIELEEFIKPLLSQEVFPQGANISIVNILAKNHIKIRTFERGAGETLACGSAACAAVASGIHNQTLSQEVKVTTPGGHLFVNWPQPSQPITLSGPATSVFKGKFSFDFKR